MGRPPACDMDLLGAAWMHRSLNEAVSALHISSDGNLYAGGWDGGVTAWSQDGEKLWSVTTEDRVGSIIDQQGTLFLAAGLHVVALDRTTGDLLWSHALEGSTDQVYWFDEHLFVTSSVYNIEHHDFIESAIWVFTHQGEQVSVQRIDERPWSVAEFESELFIALGRPRCGLLQFKSFDAEPVWYAGASESPLTCGIGGKTRGLFGHADGTVSQHDGTLMSSEEECVDSLVCIPQGFVAALDNGVLMARDSDSNPLWSSRGSPIVCQTDSELSSGAIHWTTRWSGLQGSLEIRNAESGKIWAEGQIGQTRCMTRSPDAQWVAIGCENGEVHVFQSELLERRHSQASTDSSEAEEIDLEQQAKRSALQAKLRALRDR